VTIAAMALWLVAATGAAWAIFRRGDAV
jgi:hypothetical protein